MLAGQYTSLQWLVDREARLREAVRSHSMIAWLAGFAVYICLSLVPGTSGKSVVVGWLFGFWSGVLMVDTALTVAALISFIACRYVLRPIVEARHAVVLSHWRERLRNDAAFYLLMLRFVHTPFSFVNYGAGALNVVPLSTFWWTTQLGLLPGTMVFVYAGTRIPTLAELADHGLMELLDLPLIAALIATALMPVAVRTIIRRIRKKTGRQ